MTASPSAPFGDKWFEWSTRDITLAPDRARETESVPIGYRERTDETQLVQTEENSTGSLSKDVAQVIWWGLQQVVPLLSRERLQAVLSGQRPTFRFAEYESPPEHLRNYLRMLVEQSVLSGHTAASAWKAWLRLRKDTDYGLAVPDACPGDDGELLYTWDTEVHHFELEIFPDDTGVFFYRNRGTGVIWGADYIIGHDLPEGVLDRLQLFYEQ